MFVDKVTQILLLGLGESLFSIRPRRLCIRAGTGTIRPIPLRVCCVMVPPRTLRFTIRITSSSHLSYCFAPPLLSCFVLGLICTIFILLYFFFFFKVLDFALWEKKSETREKKKQLCNKPYIVILDDGLALGHWHTPLFF